MTFRYSGLHFTWQNNCGNRFLKRKLDRVLINDEWMAFFPSSHAQFLEFATSDHSHTLVKIESDHSYNPKPFRFFNHWTKFEEFLPTVSKIWEENIQGYKLFIVTQKESQNSSQRFSF